MGIFLWIVLGIVAGSVAKLVMPGPSAGGMMVAIPIGIGGAVIGGVLSTIFVGGGMSRIDAHSVLTSICGALLALLCYRSYAMRATA